MCALRSADTLQLYGTAPDSIVDGPGIRFAVFVQGCSHRCKGCHNPTSQPFVGGYPAVVDSLVAQIEAAPLIQGVTLSGGEPFDQCDGVCTLAAQLHAKGFDLWIYSGYLFEDLMAGKPHPRAAELLSYASVLVDGPFIEDLKSYHLVWKGSANQRVIDLVKSRAAGHVVLWEEHTLEFAIPPSW